MKLYYIFLFVISIGLVTSINAHACNDNFCLTDVNDVNEVKACKMGVSYFNLYHGDLVRTSNTCKSIYIGLPDSELNINACEQATITCSFK